MWWLDITLDELALFVTVLADAQDEKPMQRHLESNPRLLVQHLRGGHGRWVIPQKRLGSEYVPDVNVRSRLHG